MGKHILSFVHHGEGTHPYIGTLCLMFSPPQDFLHTEQIHQIKTCDFLGSSIGVFKAVSFYTNTGAENVFTKPTPQLATDLVNGVEVGNMEDMRRFGFRSDLIQLLLQCGSHTDCENANAGCMGGGCSIQNQVLATAIRQQDGHLLEGAVSGPATCLGREAAADNVPQCIACIRVAPMIGDAPSGCLHLLPGAEAAQFKSCSGPVTVAHDPHTGVVRAHLKGVYQVGYPLADLLKVLLAHTGRGVQEENQVILHTFAACTLGMAAAVPSRQQ